MRGGEQEGRGGNGRAEMLSWGKNRGEQESRMREIISEGDIIDPSRDLILGRFPKFYKDDTS